MRPYVFATLLIALAVSSCSKDPVVIECERGYTGANCDQLITPSAVTITSLSIRNLPTTRPNGSGWDSNATGPDPYVVITNGSGITEFQGLVANNITPGQTITITNRLTISPAQQVINIVTYDDDDIFGREEMAGVSIPVWSSITGHIPVKEFEWAGVTYIMNLEYRF
jgi:hypothetical protein